MAKNYRPAVFPRRPKHSTTSSELLYNLELAYYRWELYSGSYVMSPGEKWALNVTVLSLLLLLLVSIYYYFPSTLRVSIRRTGYYIMGSGSKRNPDMSRMVMDPTTGAAASLAQPMGTANASSVLQLMF